MKNPGIISAMCFCYAMLSKTQPQWIILIILEVVLKELKLWN